MERISRYQGVNLYIKNIEDEIDEERLSKEFSSFGVIRSAKIMRDDKGYSRGFGFICYSTPEEAQNAIAEMNNRILQGCNKPLYVALHEPKEVRRTKLSQRHTNRKMRMNPPSAATPGPIPYPQGVYYANGNVPGIVYGPPQPQQPLLPRQRGVAWSQNMTFPNTTYPSGRGGRNGSARGNQSGSNRGRGGNARRAQPMGDDQHFSNNAIDSRLNQMLSLPPEQQRVYLGEQLYPQIYNVEPLLAGKITGMLLESGWSVEELFSLVVDESKLNAKIDEARNVLEQARELVEGDTTASTDLAGMGGTPVAVTTVSDH